MLKVTINPSLNEGRSKYRVLNKFINKYARDMTYFIVNDFDNIKSGDLYSFELDDETQEILNTGVIHLVVDKKKSPNGEFKIERAGEAHDEYNYVSIEPVVYGKPEKKDFSIIYEKIASTLRHEFEHTMQYRRERGDLRKWSYKPRRDTQLLIAIQQHVTDKTDRDDFKYYFKPVEIEAYATQLYYQAQKEKAHTNLEDVFSKMYDQIYYGLNEKDDTNKYLFLLWKKKVMEYVMKRYPAYNNTSNQKVLRSLP